MTGSAERQAAQAAEEFRRRHRLGVQPLGDLVALIEQTTGFDVAVVDAAPDEHGLSMRDPVRAAVVIGVARTRHPMRQRSTLAHELAHVVFDDWYTELTARSHAEIRADAFARHLLLPVEGLVDLLGDRESVDRADLSDVVQRFLVSPAIAAIAMRQAGYIDGARSQEWQGLFTRSLATRFGWQDYYAALCDESDQIRAPQGLVSRAITGYVEGVVGAQTIATLRGIPVEQLMREFEEAGIAPVEHPQVVSEALPPVDVDLSGLPPQDAPR